MGKHEGGGVVEGVEVEDGEINDFRLGLVLPMGQVVNNVFTG